MFPEQTILKPSDTEQFVGIPAMGYYLPPTRQSVAQVVAAGQAISDASKLTQLGFDSIRVAGEMPATQMAVEAVRDLRRRSGFDLDRIDVIVYAGALATSNIVTSDDQAAWVKDRPVNHADIAATIYSAMGLDPHLTIQDKLGRPVPIGQYGQPIEDVLA